MKQKYRSIFLVAYALLLVFNGEAQNEITSISNLKRTRFGVNNDSLYLSNIKPLSVGDIVPDLEINNVINYRDSILKVSDFSGKLLILDFWATWCSPCIAAFPKLDSLQNLFSDKIQILPVTNEDKKVVSNFLLKLKALKNIQPLTVTNDKKLSRLFLHNYLPHYVWIDQNRKVIAITDGKELNQSNIHNVLYGVKKELPIKVDVPFKITPTPGKAIFKPSFTSKTANVSIIEEVPESELLINSVLTKYIDGLYSGGRTGKTFVSVHNTSILWLYKTALWKGGLSILNNYQIVVDIEDSILYEHITAKNKSGSAITKPGLESLAWLKAHAYTYEISVPSSMENDKYDIMLEDLNKYFGRLYGIEGIMEKKNGKYLALIRTFEEDKLKSKGNEHFTKVDKFSVKIQNGSLKELIVHLQVPLQSYPPISNESNYNMPVDLEINCQLSDLISLNKELSRYGLKLEEKEKLMDIAIIRKKKK